MFKLFRYLKPVWWEVLISMILVGGQAYLQIYLPTFIGKITEGVMTSDFDIILVNSGWMLLISVGIFLLAILTGLLNAYTASILAKGIRKAVFSKVINDLSLGEYDYIGTASLITRTTNDVEMIKESYFMAVRVIIMAPIILVMAVIMTLTSQIPQLAWVLVFALGAAAILVGVVFGIVGPIFTKIQEATDRVTRVYREGITGVRVIRAFNQQPNERIRFLEANEYKTRINIKVFRIMAIISPIIMMIFNFSFIGVYFYGFALNDQVSSSQITDIAQITQVAMYIMNVMNAFMMMAMVLIQVPGAIASAKRINAILDCDPQVADPTMPVDIHSIKAEGVIEFKNVTFGYPNAEKPTLSNLNFVTRPGKVTAIIGTTGSGKSSIINLIPRFYDASEGEIFLDGVNIKNYALKDLRNRIGFVPQQATLFSGTIRSNLQFGKEDATENEMLEALEVAQAAHFVSNKENGLDSEVTQGGKNFSGGQKQRLSIARALIKKPEIYVFDDSFSALDFRTDIRLRKALKDYISNKSSVIIVAQRVASILDADNIIVLQNGEIVAQGPHNTLLKTSEVYKDIVMSQLDADEIKKTIELSEEALSGGDE